MEKLNSEEIRRYQRHLVLPQVGQEGQEKLKSCSVLVVGAGGLGAPALQYLAAAGIGKIGIYDPDQVDESNLQRQVLFSVDDLGRPKAQIACEKLRRMNPHIQIEYSNQAIRADGAIEILSKYDFVLDCTDNFPTRYVLNDACVLGGIPLVSAAIFRFEGQFSVYATREGACYRCLYPTPPPPGMVPDCASGGVLGVLPGVLGTLQAAEVIKMAVGIGRPAVNRLILYDALRTSFREMNIKKNPSCEICSSDPKIQEVREIEWSCEMGPGDEVQEMSVEELKEYRDQNHSFVLLDVREPHELQIARLDPVVEIPLGQLEARLEELDTQAEIVVLCRSGKRSATACEILMSKGFGKVWNLAGGILEYSARIDPSLQRY